MSALDGSSLSLRMREAVERSISSAVASVSSETLVAAIHSASFMPANVRYANIARQEVCASAAKDTGRQRRDTMYMARTAKMGRKTTFIREWRQHRNMTLERLADRVGMTHGNLSKIERGLQPYMQFQLEALAEALNTDPASLLIRNPRDPDGIWSLWEKVPPEERHRVIDVIKAMTGTE